MLRITALFLTVLTGFSGLVYEITWEKYLATLLGSHSEATAAVLGLFLGGLSVGYWLFGAVTRRLIGRARERGDSPRLLVVYGGLEAGIGLFALAFPTLFEAVQALSFLIPHGTSGAGFALDVALSALLILPPAVLMGGTIPMLTQALARSLDDATRFHALVYGFNTLGAFAGALAAGFWLVPTLGLVGVLVSMSVINLAAGVVFIAIGWRGADSPDSFFDDRSGDVVNDVGSDAAKESTDFRWFAGVALLCGFAMMTIQTVAIRLGGLAFGASQFTFSMVVAVFVLCIALGSFAVSALRRIPSYVLVLNIWALFAALWLLYGQLQNATYWAHRVRVLFALDPADFYPYYLTAFAGIFVWIGVPVLLSGATLPLIFHHLRREAGSLGDTAGQLYSWNTAGSFLGALLGGYALFFWLDLHQVYRVAMATLAIAAFVASLRILNSPKIAWALLPASLIAVIALPPWPTQRLSAGLFRLRNPVVETFGGPDAFFANRQKTIERFYKDGPAATVSVLEYPRQDELIDRSIFSNGKSDGSTVHDYATMALAGLLPALLADKVERSFVIGYGTGVTVGEMAALDSVEEVVVAEISPAVIDAAPLFEYANLQAATNPKVKIIESDAYRALLRSGGQFDVISSEPSNPWMVGVEMLYSREFLSAARDRLSPGGVYAQWYHSYETDSQTIEMVMRTYASVFEHVAVWFAQGPDLLLLGFRNDQHAIDIERIERRFNQPDLSAGFDRCGINQFSTLLAHELLPLGVLHATPLPGPIHTLFHPRLSYLAARSFFVGGEGALPMTAHMDAAEIGRRNSLVQRYIAAKGGSLPRIDRARMAEETCSHRPNECLALLGQWAHVAPNSRKLKRLQNNIVAKMVAANPELAGQVVLEANVAGVAALFAVDTALHDGFPPNGQEALAKASAAAQNFQEFYHHAAPFSREALAQLWQRCEADPKTRDECRKRRVEVEQRIGKLSPYEL